MDDLGLHIALFLLTTAVIVAISSMFTEADDAKALKLFPRRYFVFVTVSAAIAVVMIVFEHTFAAIS